MAKTRLYKIWANIKTRCLNPKYQRFDDYGGRGITICNEWIESFENFSKWALNNGYTDCLTIDRINNNGNYEPSNCRWVSNKINNLNKRNNLIFEYQNYKTKQEALDSISCLNGYLKKTYRRLNR